MKIPNYHEGDRSEPLAQTILSSISHVVPVPRQADYFGVDIFAHLFSASPEKLESTGTTIAIQIKSNLDRVAIEKPDALYALHALAIPFFFGVISRAHRNVSIFSTLLRFTAYWDNPKAQLIFDLESEAPGLGFNEGLTTVFCGPPIAVASLDDLDHPDYEHRIAARKALHDTLEYWIRLESDAIAWKTAGIPMSPCPPPKYSPNVSPGSIPTISLSTDMARLGPLVNAMRHSAFALAYLGEKVSERRDVDPTHERVLTELVEYAFEHLQRINEYRERLGDDLVPGDPYTID